jgi:methyl-accepting chemotaxis protein
MILILFPAMGIASGDSTNGLYQIQEPISFTSEALLVFGALGMCIGLFLFIDKAYKLTLSTKLVGGFSVTILMFMGILGYALTQMDSVGKEIETISESYLPLTTIITKITEHQLEQEIHFEKYLRTKKESEKKKYLALGHLVDTEILKGEEIANGAITRAYTQEARAQFQNIYEHLIIIGKKHGVYEQGCGAVLSFINSLNTGIAKSKLAKCERYSATLEKELIEFLEQVELFTQNSALKAEEHEKIALRNEIGLVAFALLFGLFVLAIVWKASVGLVSSVKESADGVGIGSSNVSNAAGDLYSNSVNLSTMVNKQATAVQQMASSVVEISEMSKKSADQAYSSTKKSSEGARTAKKGQQVVDDMLNSIKDISTDNTDVMNQIRESNKQISDISAIILEISEKTKVINDIVFQTKLLSFNASVEAARAGEQGKGFAVVAEEVGNLAQMSGKAAGEISQMLDKSVSKVNEIVADSEKKISVLLEGSKRRIDTGIDTSTRCGEVFSEVITIIEEVNSYVNDIATASNEQSVAVGQMNDAIHEIDDGAQTTTTIANEITAHSEILSDESKRLEISSIDLGKIVGIDHGIEKTVKDEKENIDVELDQVV